MRWSLREEAGLDQKLSQAQLIGIIKSKYVLGCPANGGLSANERAFPAEMLKPFVTAWMEEWREPPRVGIQTRDVRPFMLVAGRTGKREVCLGRLAAMLPRNDMVKW